MRDGWEIKDLGNVCGYQNGFAFKSKTYRKSGTPVIRISDIQDEKLDMSGIVHVNPDDYNKGLSRYEIVKGDLLIAMSGATTGKIGIVQVDEKFLLNQRVGKFEPGDRLDKKYLFYYLSGKVEEVLKISAGSAQPNLGTRQIKGFKIPLPPLEEQKHIVAILDKAFEAIDKARANIERNIENAKELFESKLDEIFSQGGKDRNFNKLKEVCEIRPSKREVKEILDEEELVSFVPMSHLGINSKYFKPAKSKPLGDTYKGYTYFRNGDVLLAKITPCFENGKLGIAKDLENSTGFGSTEFVVYRPQEGLIKDYLYYFLSQESFRKVGESMMDGAVGHQRIQKEFYEEYEIPIPSLSEQQSLVKELEKFSKVKISLILNFNQKIVQLKELKKSILQQAFSGQLTEPESGLAGLGDEQDGGVRKAAEAEQEDEME